MNNVITIPSGSTPISQLLYQAAQLLGEAATALYQVTNSQSFENTGTGPNTAQTSFAQGLQDTVANLQAQAADYAGQGC